MVDPPWAPVAALSGKWHKRLCCSPCPSASRVPQTQTSPKTLCGPGVIYQRPISFLGCSVYPLSSKRLPLGMASSVNGRGLRSCVTPSLGGSNPDSKTHHSQTPLGQQWHRTQPCLPGGCRASRSPAPSPPVPALSPPYRVPRAVCCWSGELLGWWWVGRGH